MVVVSWVEPLLPVSLAAGGLLQNDSLLLLFYLLGSEAGELEGCDELRSDAVGLLEEVGVVVGVDLGSEGSDAYLVGISHRQVGFELRHPVIGCRVLLVPGLELGCMDVVLGVELVREVLILLGLLLLVHLGG